MFRAHSDVNDNGTRRVGDLAVPEADEDLYVWLPAANAHAYLRIGIHGADILYSAEARVVVHAAMHDRVTGRSSDPQNNKTFPGLWYPRHVSHADLAR